MIPCAFCGEPVDPNAIGTFIEQTGWSEIRNQGGSNQLTMRQVTGRVAHRTCIHLTKRGINVNGQGVLG